MIDRSVYVKLNEGMGGAYERIAYTNIIKHWAEEYNCRDILELCGTYIAGIPGFNSCLLAQNGFRPVVTVHERDYADTLEAWDMLGLTDRATIIQWNYGSKTPFKDQEFDIVWNHLAFENYDNPAILVNEMKRISKKLVMNLTLNPFNFGYWIHWAGHIIQRDPWDHGKPATAMLRTIERVHRECGLKHVESGALDMPPWMDTVNGQIGGSMTYADTLPDSLSSKWTWCSPDPQCQNHRLVKLFWGWERTVPEWFRRLMSHHLYVISEVP